MDVLKDELIQLEAKVTEFKENGAKYKVPTLDDKINQKLRWIPDPNDPTGRRKIAVTEDQNGQLKGIQGLRQGGELTDPAAAQAEAEQKQAEAQGKKDKIIDDRNLRQYDRAKRSWEARRKEALANAKAAEMLKKPKPLAEEKPEDYQAKLSRWESGLQERIEAAAAPRIPPEPEPPVPVADQRYEQELAAMRAEAFQNYQQHPELFPPGFQPTIPGAPPAQPNAWPEGQTETGSTPMMGGGPQGGAAPLPQGGGAQTNPEVQAAVEKLPEPQRQALDRAITAKRRPPEEVTIALLKTMTAAQLAELLAQYGIK